MRPLFVGGVAAVLLLLGGCESKRHFEPKEVAGVVEFDGRLPSGIVDLLRDGATLENGMFISRDGLERYTMPDDWLFLNKAEDKYIIASRCGELRVVSSTSGDVLYQKRFSLRSPVAANLKGPMLALLFDNNSLALIDMPNDRIVFETKKPTAVANDTKIANPFFLDSGGLSLVVFPTLDGKLSVVDTLLASQTHAIVVDGEDFFNNIIYLGLINNNLIAASPHKIVAINPHFTSSLDLGIRDVVYVGDRVYILTKDGEVVLTDSSLNILKRRKFPFAHFVGAIWGEYLYIIEKGGYIIALDKDLSSYNVFEFPTKIEEPIFTTRQRVYYGDRYFELNTSR
jgi:hypothetical protein